MITVTVYTSGPSCMASRSPSTRLARPAWRALQTKRHLDRRGTAYTEQPLDEDNAAAAIELGFGTAPVVCASTAAGEQSWDGYRPDRIDALIEGAA